MNKDPEGDFPDNYYRNESGDLVAVARTNDNVDNFYTVNNDNSVVHDATRTKDEGWSRLNDDKKNGVVNRVAENKGQAPENQVNGDGLTIEQQEMAKSYAATSGSAVSGATAAGTPMVAYLVGVLFGLGFTAQFNIIKPLNSLRQDLYARQWLLFGTCKPY